MIKMTFTLAVALYAGFVIWGDPGQEMTAEASAPNLVLAGSSAEFAQPVIMTQANAADAQVTRAAVIDVIVPDAATIAASAPSPEATLGSGPRLIGEPVVVSLVRPDLPIAAAPQAAQTGSADLYKVSGTRVNMRSGPSTSNAVVDSLSGGTLTEIISDERNGWVEIRDVVSGQTGYMAARFLEPA